MILSNLHTHCWYCDGRAPMDDFVKFAKSKGLSSYGISSHAPLPFLTRWTMKEDDYDSYRHDFLRLKELYADDIQLYMALEVDYISNYSCVKNKFFQDKPFDYLVGSVHYVDKIPDGKFWNIFGTLEVFQEGLDAIFGGHIRAAGERYFECEKEMALIGGIDFIGHSDKISSRAKRYAGFDRKAAWFTNAYGDMLQCVKAQGIKIEINTKNLESSGLTSPQQDLYPLIREIGVPVVVNSDAHLPYNVDSGLRQAHQLLKNAGIKSINVFYDNKWQETEI